MANSGKTWDQLLFFESPKYAATCYSAYHGGDANAGKLAEIGSAFRQARLFYDSFKTADFAVRPLILYYSVLALSRGLILFLESKKNEGGLAQKHGLGCFGWEEFLNRETHDFTALKIKIENGTFLELLSATKNINLIRANSSAVNYQQFSPLPPVGLEVTFDTVCQRVPDLVDEYEKWTGRRLVAVKMKSLKINGDNVEVKIENDKKFSGVEKLDQQYVGNIFPNADNVDVASGTVVIKGAELPIISDIIEIAPFQIGDAVILPKIGGIRISNLGIHFIVSYTLGMLARYYPSHWIALQSIGPRGQFFPYCHRLLEYTGYTFPRMVVDVLSNLNRLK